MIPADPMLEAELAELERTDPEVAAAAAALDAIPDYFARTDRWQAARRQVRGQRTGQAPLFRARPGVTNDNLNDGFPRP